MDWILQRAKAFAAVLVSALVVAIIKTIEAHFGVDIPVGIETYVADFFKNIFSPEAIATAAATGIAVHQVPNKK